MNCARLCIRSGGGHTCSAAHQTMLHKKRGDYDVLRVASMICACQLKAIPNAIAAGNEHGYRFNWPEVNLAQSIRVHLSICLGTHPLGWPPVVAI